MKAFYFGACAGVAYGVAVGIVLGAWLLWIIMEVVS